MSEIELNGLVFKKVPRKKSMPLTFEVVSLNYGMILGHLMLEEGPGWILSMDSFQPPHFIDIGDMQTIIEFVKTKASA